MICPKLGGVVRMSSYSGYIGAVECPYYNLIYTGSVICNNIESCIEKKLLLKIVVLFMMILLIFIKDLI